MRERATARIALTSENRQRGLDGVQNIQCFSPESVTGVDPFPHPKGVAPPAPGGLLEQLRCGRPQGAT